MTFLDTEFDLEQSDSEQTNSGQKNGQKSQIQHFFENQNVLITGGTGFLGNVLIEKLLRCCSGLRKVYITVRPKRGKSASERVGEIFSSPLFRSLHNEVPGFYRKVVFIHADMELPNCGISEVDQEFLAREINVVFHAAATVKFDEEFTKAVKINTRATRDLINLSNRMERLKAFVYVSTFFSNCIWKEIREEFYTSPLSGNAAIHIVEGADNDMMAELAPLLMKQWPNSYVYTKFLTEDIIREMGEDLPIAVFRPSIVIPTAKGPVRGWINNYNGPTGVIAGATKGVLRIFQADEDCAAELVPVDYVINAIIACAWDIGSKRKKVNIKEVCQTINQRSSFKAFDDNNILESNSSRSLQRPHKSKPISSVPIYNYTSTNQNMVTWGDFSMQLTANVLKYPLKSTVWCVSFSFTKSKLSFLLYTLLLHFIPGLLFDFCLKLKSEKPRFYNMYRKIYHFSSLISFFSTRQWRCKDENVAKLWSQLNTTDKQIFYFDLKDLNWTEYFHDYILGLREHLLLESLDTLEEGRKRKRRFLVAHNILMLIVCCIVWYILWIIFGTLISLYTQDLILKMYDTHDSRPVNHWCHTLNVLFGRFFLNSD